MTNVLFYSDPVVCRQVGNNKTFYLILSLVQLKPFLVTVQKYTNG